jgi:hypothetical protein
VSVICGVLRILWPRFYWRWPATRLPVSSMDSMDACDPRAAAAPLTWGLENQEPFSDHLSAGFAWLNEGHLLGPYRYYDTHMLNATPGFEYKHGWGALASSSLDWFIQNRWFTFLRVNEALVTGKAPPSVDARCVLRQRTRTRQVPLYEDLRELG